MGSNSRKQNRRKRFRNNDSIKNRVKPLGKSSVVQQIERRTDPEHGSTDGETYSGSDVEKDTKSQVYKPPKTLAVSAPETRKEVEAKQQQREEKRLARLARSKLVEALRQEISTTPEEIGGSLVAQLVAADAETSRILREKAEQEAAEEEFLMRAGPTRKHKQADKFLRQKQRDLLSGRTEVESLNSFIDNIIKS